jgi:hypothetical protein
VQNLNPPPQNVEVNGSQANEDFPDLDIEHDDENTPEPMTDQPDHDRADPGEIDIDWLRTHAVREHREYGMCKRILWMSKH